MNKKIIIDGKEIEFKTSAAIPRLYRLEFKRDVFLDFKSVSGNVTKKGKNAKEVSISPEAISVIENLAYIMAKHADPSIDMTIDEWLGQFSTMAIYSVAKDILTMWNEEQKMMSSPKK